MTVAHLTLRVDREYLAYLMAKAALQTIIQGQREDPFGYQGTDAADLAREALRRMTELEQA